MPELPEVETIASQLRGRIVGRTISAATLERPDYLRSDVPGFPRLLVNRVVQGVTRQGKRMSVLLDNGASLLFHLGMSGRMTFEPIGSEIAPHTHFRLRFRQIDDELRMRDPRRFGGIWYAAAAEVGAFGRLGPDALDLDERKFVELCRRRRQIKALMLDQQAISGLGNIYCDEALFEARIHPQAIASQLRLNIKMRLAHAIRTTLDIAIQRGGSTLRDYVDASGLVGGFQELHKVYGREGQPCPRCSRPIERIQAAGRSTHFCRNCQRCGARQSAR